MDETVYDDAGRAYKQLHLGGVDDDDQRCLRCGSPGLDTGWECNDCGYDNMPHYVEPKKDLNDGQERGR
ncbi:hypothetical protein [Stenotrophomonas sp. GD04024]|uniref:hypothetical protein n=1 Tax=Stenotrophomonas TaxID=40323 RepID=UPI002446E97A|nr:hypothetical protein [Stenotrophomonas sp. GD04024]MDG9990063.1 hypothetical protein [Stenotrophomonas sp. GD04024]